jgi:hypothetical protein
VSAQGSALTNEAYELLAPMYNWFTERFDTRIAAAIALARAFGVGRAASRDSFVAAGA